MFFFFFFTMCSFLLNFVSSSEYIFSVYYVYFSFGILWIIWKSTIAVLFIPLYYIYVPQYLYLYISCWTITYFPLETFASNCAILWYWLRPYLIYHPLLFLSSSTISLDVKLLFFFNSWLLQSSYICSYRSLCNSSNPGMCCNVNYTLFWISLISISLIWVYLRQ